MRLATALLVLGVFMVANPPAFPQEARGTILGRVTDSSGAVIPGVSVQVVSEATNVAITAVTNEQGNYQAPLLIPGAYRISAGAAGFKNFLRRNLELRVDDRLEINFTMELGAVTDTITVTEETPLLETTNASIGSVVDARRVAELPVAHGNPFHLIQLAPGVSYIGDPKWDRPYEPAHSAGYSMSGSRGYRNEITLDGVSNTSTTNDNVVTSAYVPPADVVAEFKVQTATFDATVGQTEGGAVNVSLKSGGNQPHGTLYFMKMMPGWNANLFFANRAGTPQSDFTYNRWGASSTGPVYLPKVYDGRNRTFYTYGYEGIHESRPRGTTLTVPTAAERGGDFSALLKLGSQYQIYDPFTRRRVANGRIQADPLAGNIVAKSRIHPIAGAILNYYPLPTEAGTADGRNNLPLPNEPEPITYYTHVFRVDHNISSRHRIFVRGNIYKRASSFSNWFHNESTGNYFQSLSRGAAFDDVFTISPTFVANVRLGISRFIQYNDGPPVARAFDLTKLGFSKSYNDAIPADIRRFPNIGIDGYAGASTPYSWRPAGTISLPVAFDKVQGSHGLKFGGEFRAYRENLHQQGSVATGTFNFTSNYMRGPLDNSPAAPIGQGLAAMLLGIANDGSVQRQASYAEQSTVWSWYFQDDWKATPRLTINLGLRYELEGPLTERYNRSVRGFDPNAALPIEEAARKAYALNPIPEISPAQFRVRGGLNFAGVGGNPRTLWQRDTNNFMPRFGFALRTGSKAVVRGGYGLFYGFLGARRGDVLQYGFSQKTNYVPTQDQITFGAKLADPFPGGILEPPGAAAGAMTYAGQGIAFFNSKPTTPYTQRWQLGLQRELPRRMVLDVAYVGNRGTAIETDRNVNALSASYLSTSLVRDQTTIDYLTRNFANPFLGLLPNTARSGSNISRAELLRPHPQFTGITLDTSEGFSWYHSAQINLEKRFSDGYTLNASYTFSKFMEATSFLNETDARPYRAVSDQDRPHRVSASLIYEFPFGRGRHYLSGSGGVTNALLGGWQYQAIFARQSGQPINFGNLIFNGDVKKIPLPAGQRTPERWFNVDAGFDRDTRNQLGWNVRKFPLRFSGVRDHGANNWDMSLIKNGRLGERARLQFRFEFLNAMNHVWFAAPNNNPYNSAFGTINSERAYARRVQAGLKAIF